MLNVKTLTNRDDFFIGNDNVDSFIFAKRGNDMITETDQSDDFYSLGFGDDYAFSYFGNDVIMCGRGNDNVVIGNETGEVTVFGGSGYDTLTIRHADMNVQYFGFEQVQMLD